MSDCAICYESLSGDLTTITLECVHTFHYDCADKWIARTCPMCRRDYSDLLPRVSVVEESSFRIEFVGGNLYPPRQRTADSLFEDPHVFNTLLSTYSDVIRYRRIAPEVLDVIRAEPRDMNLDQIRDFYRRSERLSSMIPDIIAQVRTSSPGTLASLFLLNESISDLRTRIAGYLQELNEDEPLIYN